MTANQARDNILEDAQLTTATVRVIRNLGLECNEVRKTDPETYLKCPRCKGLHSIHGNFDDLCDPCQETILKHFPEHESVPHIKAANAQWAAKR